MIAEEISELRSKNTPFVAMSYKLMGVDKEEEVLDDEGMNRLALQVQSEIKSHIEFHKVIDSFLQCV